MSRSSQRRCGGAVQLVLLAIASGCGGGDDDGSSADPTPPATQPTSTVSALPDTTPVPTANASPDTTLAPPDTTLAPAVTESGASGASGDVPPCVSLTADEVTAVVEQPVVESRELAAQWTADPIIGNATDEICVFAPLDFLALAGVVVQRSDDPRARDYITLLLGAGGNNPLPLAEGLGEWAVTNAMGGIGFCEGERCTVVNVIVGPAGQGAPTDEDVTDRAMTLTAMLTGRLWLRLGRRRQPGERSPPVVLADPVDRESPLVPARR